MRDVEIMGRPSHMRGTKHEDQKLVMLVSIRLTLGGIAQPDTAGGTVGIRD